MLMTVQHYTILNTVQNSSDNILFYPADNDYSSDALHWRTNYSAIAACALRLISQNVRGFSILVSLNI